jgi:4-carboxymuconolactone decarboxylase
MSDLTDKGRATRSRVLGAAHVARSEARATPFDTPFLALITDAAWGHVWSRETLPLRERSMLTIALLAGLGNHEELALHIRGSANTGTSEADVMEVLLHVAIYAGVPRANSAMQVARDTFAAMRGEGTAPPE